MNLNINNKLIIGAFLFSFAQHVHAKPDAPYTCYSSHAYAKGLDSSSDTKPVAGAQYVVPVGGDNTSYEATCTGNDDYAQKEDYFYSGEYTHTYESTGDGFVKLNDYVDVKTAVHIQNNGNVIVPFHNIDNGSPQYYVSNDSFYSGDSGEVTIRLRKSIFSGEIVIPSFSVNLYAKFGTGGDYNDRPLTVINFKESTINVKALCSVSPLSFSKEGISSSSAEKQDNTGRDILHISCDSAATDGTVYLTFKGEKFPSDSRFFMSKMHEVGIGIKNDAGDFISPDTPLKIAINNGNASLPLNFVSFFKKTAGAPSISNTADLEIKSEIKTE